MRIFKIVINIILIAIMILIVGYGIWVGKIIPRNNSIIRLKVAEKYAEKGDSEMQYTLYRAYTTGELCKYSHGIVCKDDAKAKYWRNKNPLAAAIWDQKINDKTIDKELYLPTE
jgi:hypothetical protein